MENLSTSPYVLIVHYTLIAYSKLLFKKFFVYINIAYKNSPVSSSKIVLYFCFGQKQERKRNQLLLITSTSKRSIKEDNKD